LLAAFAFLTACSATIPADATTSVVSLARLDDGERGGELAKAMSEQHGVYRASFDPRTAELTILSSAGVDAVALAKRLRPADATYEAVGGAGHGAYIAWETAPEGADVKVIAIDGVDVPELDSHLVRGKVTLVDFSARWCAPCRTLDAHILKTMGGRTDVAYRKIEIGDWDSPVARHYMKNVATLPFVIVFDKQGYEIDRVIGVDEDRLDAAIAKASRGS
jgi:thiol-disulfide isomerase/thioredoxin